MSKTTLRTIDYDAILHELTTPQSNMADRNKHRPDLEGFLSEHRTVWIGSPRQTGKTEWISKRIVSESNSVVVTVNLNFKNLFLELTKEVSKINPNELTTQVFNRAFTARDLLTDLENLERNASTPYPLDTVYVDEAFFVLDYIKRKHLYQWIAMYGTRETRVVMVTT